MYDEYDDEADAPRRTGLVVGVIVGLVVVAATAWLLVVCEPATSNTDQTVTPAPSTAPTQVTAAVTARLTPTSVSGTRPSSTSVTPATSSSPASHAGAASGSASTVPPTPPPTTTTAAVATYDTLPDGTPVPVLALFGESGITLSGVVPDDAAKERLRTLALANAKPGQDHVE